MKKKDYAKKRIYIFDHIYSLWLSLDHIYSLWLSLDAIENSILFAQIIIIKHLCVHIAYQIQLLLELPQHMTVKHTTPLYMSHLIFTNI